MNNYTAIKCKECNYHYTNDYEKPIGEKWCKRDRCMKAEKGDVRTLPKEINLKYDIIKEDNNNEILS